MNGSVGDAKREKWVLRWSNHPKALLVAVPNSFALAATRMGWDLTIDHPEGYDLPESMINRCKVRTAATASGFQVTRDRAEALDGAQFVFRQLWCCWIITARPKRYWLGLKSWIVDEAATRRRTMAISRIVCQ